MHSDTFILVVLIAAALWTVMTRSLLRAAIGLALASAVLTVIMFRLGSPLAAVFELSVCAGLIPVLFVSTISLTEPMTQQEILQHMKDRLHRFWVLPLIVIVIGVLLSLTPAKLSMVAPLPEAEKDVRLLLWNLRPLDLLGQVIILLCGVFGVIILIKERPKNG